MSASIPELSQAISIGGKVFTWGAKTFVMGVVNVTPDSFSGDGTGNDIDAATDRALQFEAWGADIIDIGGESTRPPGIYPDAAPVAADEEKSRVIPVIEAIRHRSDIPISIDTYKSEVAEAAILAGASMINDIWGFKRDKNMVDVAVESRVPVVLMHNQTHTRYTNVVGEIIAELDRMTLHAVQAGVPRTNIIVDPGIGFGKTAEQNLEILRTLDRFADLRSPMLIGTSRKSTIGYVLGLEADDRVEGTAATVALAIAKGTDIVRVHDVKQMVRVARMSDAVVRGWTRK